jgi:hypothetical protein
MEVVEIDNLYAVSLPAYLEAGYDMHEYAALQYYNTRLDFYVMGIYDDKSKWGPIKQQRLKLDRYFKYVEESVLAQADSFHCESMEAFTTLQGISAKVGDYQVNSRFIEDTFELFYRVVVYESSTHFFQLVIWMPYDVHCERMPQIEQITYSFRLLPEEPTELPEQSAQRK